MIKLEEKFGPAVGVFVHKGRDRAFCCKIAFYQGHGGIKGSQTVTFVELPSSSKAIDATTFESDGARRRSCTGQSQSKAVMRTGMQIAARSSIKRREVDIKWEYRLFPAGLDREEHIIQQTLNNHGKDGWELVTVYEFGFCSKTAISTAAPSC